ncbi:CYTH domain-containing protein [Marinobacter sp.]|uniref:CYTH domain-containing protein n=1 Tax=Marinobacter sp. TaxID=50741 RepID=UPI000C620283|nr:CYTH domain-containing protein [Marinobacter sp.]MAO13667.1 adenylate cyclase [Marinobacter sp.]|tara:strand:+ start:3936 stop:4817 length:882 start_codon:yes stop_codon:yes gene_type:complete
MAVELEIKLTLSEWAQAQTLEWLLAQPEARPGGQKRLANRYYDTPDAALNRARAALRVRQSGNRYIQTLKTQGEFVDGAHRRQEWEWPLPGPELDLSLLESTPLKQQLDLQQLQVAFETNFTREVVMLETEDAVVEVAVDSGEIVGGGQSRALHEVEFELKSGNPASLMSWARMLADEVPVFLNLVSKAEQGYYLAGIYRPELDPPPVELSVTEFLQQLSLSWLLQKPLNCPEAALLQVKNAAIQAGVQALWDEIQPITGQHAVPELIEKAPRLGALQLALADASANRAPAGP